VKRQYKWLILALCLLPVLVGLVVLALDQASGGTVMFGIGKRIGVIRIEDVILDAEQTVSQLGDFAEDATIAGVVLRLDSPGGAVAPSQEIYDAVLRFEESGKPLVVSMGNVAASGAYYIASAADRIFANPGTLTGSIGVIMRVSHVYELFDKLGIEVETITAGEYKDVGSPHRKMTPAEREYLETLIQDMYRQFINDVADGRSMEVDTIERYAKGQVYTGQQAVQAGLVDTLGSMFDAQRYTKEAAGLPPETEVYEVKKGPSFWRELLSSELLGGARLVKNAFWPSGIYYLYEAG